MLSSNQPYDPCYVMAAGISVTNYPNHLRLR